MTDPSTARSTSGVFGGQVRGRRYFQSAADTVMYEFTIDDPVTYTKPWTAEIPWVKTNGLIFEYACHEGNYALKNVLSGARTAENNSR